MYRASIMSKGIFAPRGSAACIPDINPSLKAEKEAQSQSQKKQKEKEDEDEMDVDERDDAPYQTSLIKNTLAIIA